MISPLQRPLPDKTRQSQETKTHAREGFKPTIPESERPQTHALDRAVTGTGKVSVCQFVITLTLESMSRTSHVFP